MAYEDRIKLYEKIEESRGKPLISYFTSLRPNASAQMASDVISEFAKQIIEVPIDKKEIDIKVKAIAESLNKSFYHHGYPLGRKEAKEIGLSVA